MNKPASKLIIEPIQRDRQIKLDKRMFDAMV